MEQTYKIKTTSSGDDEVTVDKGFPDDLDDAEKLKGYAEKDWMDLLNSNDGAKRAIPMTVLKRLGHEPTRIIKWSKPGRAQILVAHATFGASTNGKTATTKAAATSAKPKAAAAETTKSATTTTGDGDNTAVLKAVAGTNAKLAELEAKVDEINAFVKDMHAMVRILIASGDETLQQNVTDLGPDLFGGLQFEVESAEGNAD